MALSGNKGEWSEIYALFRLLGEGKVHAGDANMNKLELYYPIIDIIRKEAKRYEYKPDVKRNIVIIDEDGVEYARIPMDKFVEEANSLLVGIKKSKGRGAFEVPSAEAFMKSVGCSKIKQANGKSDIRIIIHDLRTNMTPQLGFSIKSQLGSPASILNASSATMFLYAVTGNRLTDGQIEEINSIEGHLPRMKALLDCGCKLEYKDIESKTFKNNLLFMDCCMPRFIAECLLAYSMPGSKSHVKDVVGIIAKRNPFEYTGEYITEFYEHKMKVLLIDSALGMTPATPWIGRYDANGGYIVVRDDGEIVCYHFYNKNDVEDYLFNNTCFDRPGRKRHQYGSLFRAEDGNVYIKLNLQIRFIK